MFKHKVAAMLAAVMCLILFTMASAMVPEGPQATYEVSNNLVASAEADSDVLYSEADVAYDGDFSMVEMDAEVDAEVDADSEVDAEIDRPVARAAAAARAAPAPRAAAPRPAARAAARRMPANRAVRGAGPRRIGKARRAARRVARKARRAARRAARKARRAARRAGRKARRAGRKARRGARKAGRKGKKIARKGRKLGRKLRRKIGRKGKKIGRKGKKFVRKGKKFVRKGKKFVRKAGNKLRKLVKGKTTGPVRKVPPKPTRSQRVAARKFAVKTNKARLDMLGTKALQAAEEKVRKDALKARTNADAATRRKYSTRKYPKPDGGVNWHPLDNLNESQLMAEARKLRTQLANKREALRKKRAADIARVTRKVNSHHITPLKRVPKYKGSIRIGHYMTGGPISKPSKTPRTWLQKFQATVMKRDAKRSPAVAQRRKAIIDKMDRLYATAKPTENTFVLEFLQARGQKIPAALALKEWAAAKKWFYAQRVREIKEEKRDAKILKQAEGPESRAEKEVSNDLAKIEKEFSAPNSKQIDKMATQEEQLRTTLWKSVYPATPTGKDGADNWWGCIDCAQEPSAPVKKASGKKPAAKKSAAKKAGPKKAGPKKIGGKAGVRKIGGKKGKKPAAPKIAVDLTFNNVALLAHYLNRFRMRNDVELVKEAQKDVIDRLKKRIVEKTLTQAERNEITMAKVEELEKTVAYNAGAVNMVKRGVIKGVKPRRNRFPDPDPPKSTNFVNYEREADIQFARGFLQPSFRTDRDSLDIASLEDRVSRDFHDDIVKQHNIIRKDIVWKMFDGPGDSTQIRSEEVNRHRKRHPNVPMPDGSSPWF